MTQIVESAEDIPLRTYDRHRATRLSKRFIEHVAFRVAHLHLLHALLATLHSMAQCSHRCVLLLQGLRKDGLSRNLHGIRMHKVRSAPTYHNTIRIRIRLRGRYGLREPVQRQTGVNGANELALIIPDGLTVARHHLARVRSRIEIHVRLRPARLVQQLSHQIPVHIEVLVIVATALNGSDTVAHMLGISREVAPVLLIVIRLEGNGAGVEVRIVQQHASTVHKHRVGTLRMSHHQPFGNIRCHLYPVQDTLYA